LILLEDVPRFAQIYELQRHFKYVAPHSLPSKNWLVQWWHIYCFLVIGC